MELVVSLIHPKHRPMYELLAATGVRRSELLAFEVRHLHLTGHRPHMKCFSECVDSGNGLVIGPPKSRHARRITPMGSS